MAPEVLAPTPIKPLKGVGTAVTLGRTKSQPPALAVCRRDMKHGPKTLLHIAKPSDSRGKSIRVVRLDELSA